MGNEILDINSGNIDTILNNGITESEAKAILDKLSNITEPLPNNLDKVRNDLREINIGKKELSETIKSQLKELLQIVESKNDSNEKITKNETFSELNESVSEKSKIMEKLFSISDIYFDDKLKSYNLSTSEKENAKLVLWDNIMNKVNFEGGMGIIVKSITGKVSELFGGFESGSGKKDNLDNLSTIIDNLTKIQDNLLNQSQNEKSNKLFSTLDEMLGYNFKNIEKAKDTNIKFETLESAYMCINGDSKDIKTFYEIKKNTLEKVKSFDGLKNTGENVIGLFDNLPSDWGDKVKDYLKEISTKYPILGFIIGLFFGEGFIDGVGEKGKINKSILNLSSIVEKSDTNSEFNKLNLEGLKNLDPKKLERFFIYLDGKDIDYTDDNFWKGVLIGDTKDEKLLKINEIFKSGNGTIIENDGLNSNDKLYKKLNNISNLENNYNQKIEEDELKKLQEQNKITNITTTTTKEDNNINKETQNKSIVVKKESIKSEEDKKNQVESPKVLYANTNNKEILQSPREMELMFNQSVRNINTLPSELLYKGEKVKISFQDNKIVLGENMYSISLFADIPFIGNKDVFRGISFNNGNIEISHIKGKKEISKEQLIIVLSGLLDKQSYSLLIPAEKAKLEITKIA